MCVCFCGDCGWGDTVASQRGKGGGGWLWFLPVTYTHTQHTVWKFCKEVCLANIWELVQVAFWKLSWKLLGARRGALKGVVLWITYATNASICLLFTGRRGAGAGLGNCWGGTSSCSMFGTNICSLNIQWPVGGESFVLTLQEGGLKRGLTIRKLHSRFITLKSTKTIAAAGEQLPKVLKSFLHFSAICF